MGILQNVCGSTNLDLLVAAFRQGFSGERTTVGAEMRLWVMIPCPLHWGGGVSGPDIQYGLG
jgi:hypothetical protein